MKLLVSAYADKNLGDDLMIRLLAQTLSDCEIHLENVSKINMTPFNDLPNVKSCDVNGRPWERMKIRRKYDIYIRIGGSIFIFDNKNVIKNRIKKLIELLDLKLHNIPMGIVGCNVGPFISKPAELVAKMEMKLSQIVTVRDEEAREFAVNAGIEKTRKFPDMILSYPIKKDKSTEKGCLGISVYRSIYNPQFNLSCYKKMAEIADDYIDKTGNKVLLFAFASGYENDIAAAYEIFEMIENKELVEIIVHIGDTNKVLYNLSRCNSIIAIRFHAAILAMKMNIPFLPVIYSNKMNNMLDEIGYNGNRIYMSNISELATEMTVDSLIEGTNLCKNVDVNYINQASGHMVELRKFIDQIKCKKG